MTDEVKRKLKKNLDNINFGFNEIIMNDKVADNIAEMEFEALQILLEYSKKLRLE
uniref:hypothetical protein n=1 Tax=Coprococcus catus TaxID=116085 RepID=UPI0022E1A4E5|nr:hypothetical protein [Coprococcus catus]